MPSKHFLWKRSFHHLFKPLFDVRVCLQLELSARVGPVHEEEPLLGVHLFDQYGCFLVVPHLKKAPLPLNSPPYAKNYVGSQQKEL